MPHDSRGSVPDPLAPSYSESVTLPYEELQELKAAAAAAATGKALSVTMPTPSGVNPALPASSVLMSQ